MIVGHVANDEPNLSLEIQGLQSDVVITAVIDTGFSGFLALPHSIIQSCGFVRVNTQDVLLADGSTSRIDVYEASVRWDGRLRVIPAYGVSGGALIGMKMLRGTILTIEVEDGGAVTIEAI